ncbi:hypothetical protein [Actinophytocola sp.]|uniref:hypothetical protein n=1 Tax=Actinophytocola sp. TaxID=1872138 RepID=UPI002D34FFE0|nr:hypothetical protein [Actinophytocola sp.]HYQ66159.1 hypothetical protein [Actinophytocola sp.]
MTPRRTPEPRNHAAGVPVRAVSVARPWAGLILHRGKDVENRTWSTRYRGLLVIHASQSWDQWPDDIARQFALPADKGGHPTGYLGVAELVDVHRHTDDRQCSPWAEPSTWHWCLTNPRPFPHPIPGPGRLGLYTPPPAVVTAARAACSGGGV